MLDLQQVADFLDQHPDWSPYLQIGLNWVVHVTGLVGPDGKCFAVPVMRQYMQWNKSIEGNR